VWFFSATSASPAFSTLDAGQQVLRTAGQDERALSANGNDGHVRLLPESQWHVWCTLECMTVPATADALNNLTSIIISAAIGIHRTFGSGLLEHAYLACLCHELKSAGLALEVQKPISLIYRGVKIDCAYRADLIIEGVVLVEVKAIDALAPFHERQLNTYLRLTECPVGLLLNFGAPTMKAGIKRVVNGFPS
jgi:GxxExxY protein